MRTFRLIRPARPLIAVAGLLALGCGSGGGNHDIPSATGVDRRKTRHAGGAAGAGRGPSDA